MATVRALCAQDDFDEVGEVYVESWKASYRDLLPQAFLEKLTHDRWSAMLNADPSSSLGLFDGDRVVGTAMVSFAREPGREGYGEIVSIYLLPDYAGRGYGRLLMEAAFERLRSDGAENVCLWAFSKNTRAEGFYEHMGFVRSGRVQTEAFGGETTELTEFVRGLKG